jgi:hypothetical protein
MRRVAGDPFGDGPLVPTEQAALKSAFVVVPAPSGRGRRGPWSPKRSRSARQAEHERDRPQGPQVCFRAAQRARPARRRIGTIAMWPRQPVRSTALRLPHRLRVFGGAGPAPSAPYRVDPMSEQLPTGPSRPEDRRPLEVGLFRAERQYLADHVFALVSGGDEPPNDVVPREAWEGMMDLPTDVLLRTTDYLGRMVDDLHDQGNAWIHAAPMQPNDSQFMFEPSLDASDEFQAAPFVAMHGWYRQATAGLRNALEAMACGAAFAVRKDTAHYADWRAGSFEPKFGNAVELLAADSAVAALDGRLGLPGLFGRKPNGVAQETYNKLCRYAHSRAGYTNADIWQSNGPVFIPRAFTQFWTDFCDTVALSYVLLKIGWPKLVLADVARPLFGWASQRWGGIGEAVEAELFPNE